MIFFINLDKSKIVHLRTLSVTRTDFQFSLNGNSLETVSQYMYLGLLSTEFLKYDMGKAVAKSASRPLGLLIAKCKANGGFEFSIFFKLFETLIMSVIEYGALYGDLGWMPCIVLLSSGLVFLQHGQYLSICVIVDRIRMYFYGAMYIVILT